GIGLTAVAFMYLQPDKEIVLQQPAPAITVDQPDIVVQAPDNTELTEQFSKLSASIDSVVSTQNIDRQQIAGLTEQVLKSEAEKDALRQAMADMQEQHQAQIESLKGASRTPPALPELQTPPVAKAKPETVNVDANLIRLNALLAADGYSKTQFQRAGIDPSQTKLHDVIVLNWDAKGKLSSMIEAEVVELEMHKMSHNLVMVFKGGTRTIGSSPKVALAAEGLRFEFEEINVDAWQEFLPQLLPAAATVNSGGADISAADTEQVRVALDALVSKRGSFSYYKLSSLGQVVGNELRYVQINWHDNSGRLVKTIEADSLIVVLHKSGSVELQMRNGAFLAGNQRSPFASDRFSLHLPRQQLGMWRDSQVPFIEAGF
ncbi:MAG: hypothetical protein QGF46_06455, partial [Planctomycetota bacterium]|nr:hypothetical protein [Planctomycetota bacterium]